MSLTVYQTSSDGLFCFETDADESPLEPGVFLIPRGCVREPPPKAPYGYRARYVAGRWDVEQVPSGDGLALQMNRRGFFMFFSRIARGN